jgi:antibiotic biosynthesis monooxygenase (ABM) superfamily enzyme
MIIRTAVLEGSVAAADRAGFDRQMNEDVLQAIATYPGIRDVRIRWPAESEAGAPDIYVLFDLYFDSLEAMHAALASPVRHQVREKIGAVMPAFKGRVYHLVLEERAA